MSSSVNRINNICLIIIATYIIGASLIFTKPVLLPFLLALFLFAAVSPAVKFIESKTKFKYQASVLLTIFLVLLGGALLSLIVVTSLQNFIQEADVYRKKVFEFISHIQLFAAKFGYHLNADSLQEELKNLPVLDIAKKFTGGLVNLLGNIVLIVIIFIFLIMGRKPESGSKLVDEILLKTSNYLSTKLVLSVATGVLVGLVLFIAKVDLAMSFALLTILLNFIPNVGSLIATVIPLPIVFLQYGFGWQFFFVLSASLVSQFVIGNVIEPKLMGESMDLHPITVLLFLLFWGLVWGLPGMFLAVPITALVKIICSRIEPTKPFAELMAGRFQN